MSYRPHLESGALQQMHGPAEAAHSDRWLACRLRQPGRTSGGLSCEAAGPGRCGLSLQSPQVGVGGLGGLQADPGIDGLHAVRAGENRAELELGDLRQVVGHPGDAQQQAGAGHDEGRAGPTIRMPWWRQMPSSSARAAPSSPAASTTSALTPRRPHSAAIPGTAAAGAAMTARSTSCGKLAGDGRQGTPSSSAAAGLTA